MNRGLRLFRSAQCTQVLARLAKRLSQARRAPPQCGAGSSQQCATPIQCDALDAAGAVGTRRSCTVCPAVSAFPSFRFSPVTTGMFLSEWLCAPDPPQTRLSHPHSTRQSSSQTTRPPCCHIDLPRRCMPPTQPVWYEEDDAADAMRCDSRAKQETGRESTIWVFSRLLITHTHHTAHMHTGPIRPGAVRTAGEYAAVLVVVRVGDGEERGGGGGWESARRRIH